MVLVSLWEHWPTDWQPVQCSMLTLTMVYNNTVPYSLKFLRDKNFFKFGSLFCRFWPILENTNLKILLKDNNYWWKSLYFENLFVKCWKQNFFSEWLTSFISLFLQVHDNIDCRICIIVWVHVQDNHSGYGELTRSATDEFSCLTLFIFFALQQTKHLRSHYVLCTALVH